MINKVTARIKALSNKDQIIFARLFRDEIAALISGHEESATTLLEALDEWDK